MDTDSDFLASDYDSLQSEDIKNVWYFQPILEHIVFIWQESPTKRTFLHEFVVIGTTLESDMILSHLVYDGQFFLYDYYKVGKYMMPSVLKSVQILKVM